MAPKTYRLNTSGNWSEVKKWYRLSTSGAWQTIKNIYRLSTSGNWSLVFTSAVSPTATAQSEITLSAADSTTGLRSLTGKHYHWNDTDTLYYGFEKSTDNVSYTSLSSGVATNPGIGSSTTNTVNLLNNGTHVVANTTNYYRYYTKGVNSTYNTEAYSYSSTVTVEGARNISGLTASGQTTSSVNLSWNASFGANSYRVYYGYPSGSYGLTVDTSSTSITINSLLSDTTYFFAVRPYTGSLVSGSVTGYEGNLSTEVSRKTDAPPPTPQLSTPTNFQVWNYNASTGEIQVKWNAVANATNYWIFMYSASGTLIQSADNSNSLTWSPSLPQFLSENTTYRFDVYAAASGYLNSPTATITYTTPAYPAIPTNFSWVVSTNSIEINSFVGGTTPRILYLYKYQSLFSAPTYQTVIVSASSSVTFSNLSPGSVYDLQVYGGSYGIINGSQTLFTSSNFIAPYGRYIPTAASSLPLTGTNTSFTAGAVGTTSIGYTRVPASIPSQTTYFAMLLWRWNGSSWIYQTARFHRIDGSSFDDDPAHTGGYGALSNMNGFFLGLSSGYYYLVECRTWNNVGYDSAGSGSQVILL